MSVASYHAYRRVVLGEKKISYSGSSGSSEGVGTSTISCSEPFPCFVLRVRSLSMRRTVPGGRLLLDSIMNSGSGIDVMLVTKTTACYLYCTKLIDILLAELGDVEPIDAKTKAW